MFVVRWMCAFTLWCVAARFSDFMWRLRLCNRSPECVCEWVPHMCFLVGGGGVVGSCVSVFDCVCKEWAWIYTRTACTTRVVVVVVVRSTLIVLRLQHTWHTTRCACSNHTFYPSMVLGATYKCLRFIFHALALIWLWLSCDPGPIVAAVQQLNLHAVSERNGYRVTGDRQFVSAYVRINYGSRVRCVLGVGLILSAHAGDVILLLAHLSGGRWNDARN